MISIPAKNVKSLAFTGDDLVDWAGGARVFDLDGKDHGSRINYTYRFDAATSSPDGRYTVLYERLGTKALLLDGGKLLRELNRSYYCAGAYEYPVHLFCLPDGRTVIAHCPDEYNRIEFEEVATGRRLTESSHRKPEDFFHSRLSSNPSGTRLLSAGWVWHPWDAVVYFDIGTAIRDPTHLDSLTAHSPFAFNVSLAEESSACWLSDDQVAVGSSTEEEDAEEAAAQDDAVRLLPSSVGVFDVPSGCYLRSFRMPEPVGTMMRIDPSHVVSFYKHPKVISLTTGEVVQEWPELRTGTQTSSICHHLKESIPPLAFDPERRRFAVASADAIHVVTVGLPGPR
jgi:hypothetical protein